MYFTDTKTCCQAMQASILKIFLNDIFYQKFRYVTF